MAKSILRTGKKVRPKTAVKGKRFRCAKCRRRSPKPVKTPAPWYCPHCLTRKESAFSPASPCGSRLKIISIVDQQEPSTARKAPSISGNLNE
jgi:ribosomal protein L37AE/L43A